MCSIPYEATRGPATVSRQGSAEGHSRARTTPGVRRLSVQCPAGSEEMRNDLMDDKKFLTARRHCGARTRNGHPCRSPAVRGKRRCRMHGGATGSGAPLGNKNALRHGHYTAEAIAERLALAALIRVSRATLADLGKPE